MNFKKPPEATKNDWFLVEKKRFDILDLIPSPSVKIQIIVGKVYLR